MPEWSCGLPLSVRTLEPAKYEYTPCSLLRMFNCWMALSTGYIALQRMNIRENNCIILEVVIYPVDSVTHLTNNWSLA